MMRKLLLFFSFLIVGLNVHAQFGEIQGRVTDAKTGEAVGFASVSLVVNGSTTGAQTDFDGFYSIKPLPAGSYDVKISFVGYQAQETRGVLVNTDKITYLDAKLSEESQLLNVVEVKAYKVPLLQSDQTSTGNTVTKEDIQNMPTRSVNTIASQSAGVYQKDEGGGLNVKGSRDDATDVYIDGIKVRGTNSLPASAIEQLTVVTGGLPARYGDATGGIINITTRGPSKDFAGGVELVTSKFLDSFGYYLGNLSLSGPLIKINRGTDKERAIAGFFISGEYLHEDDDDPSYVGSWKVKDDVLNQIRQTPLIPSTSATGFVNRTSLVTVDDLEKIDARNNVAKDQVSVAGKLDIQPVQNLNFTFGGTYNYSTGGTSRSYYTGEGIRRFSLFSPEHTPKQTFNDYRAYFRITQRLGGQKDANSAEKTTPSVLQNVYYTLQFDYSKSKGKVRDPLFGDNLFEYGYVGQFNVFNEPIYLPQIDNPLGLTGTYLSSYTDTAVVYTPGTSNPERAAYVSNYVNLTNDRKSAFQSNIDQFRMSNGGVPSSVSAPYSLWNDPGTPWGGILDDDNDQYRLTFNGSFDLRKPNSSERNKHAIEFGFEYEQRVDRRYNLFDAVGLWDIMYQETGRWNNGFGFDLDNPILVIDGQEIPFSEYNGSGLLFDNNDTVRYNLVRTNQTFFDQKFREKFGYGETQFVSVFNHKPEDFSLDMFTADELLRQGGNAAVVSYYGFDHRGNKLTSQYGFEDFWKLKDADGNYVRPINAFRPVYIAGYLQDKFSFKDLIFNVGVRVDRYDANQKVPKDKYSPLYGVRTASEVTELGAHPNTIGDDFVVYVNDPQNPTAIRGYRDNNQWYDKDGKQVVSPDVVAEGARIYPYLVPGQNEDYQSETYNPNLAFEDYKPQINVMPRVAFSFELSEEAIFFAHYDVLTQRPQGRAVTDPSDYYFLEQTIQAGSLSNPNLKPEKTIDYQIGFKQKIGQSSALTISGFYRELRDMLQIQNITYAYPAFQYTTYGNIDFGTVKGLELTYDLRRTQNIRMTATYTLQYADGTGSGDRSQANLVSNGKPNLRAIFPLSYDSRHMVNISFDYRFGGGADYNGPKIGKANILANTGLNLILRGRSGEPYTRQSNPTTSQFGVSQRSNLEGSINGSRLPFNYRMDLRLDKDIPLKFGKNQGKADRSVNIYFLVQNLLNTANINGVYAYTGAPGDDGYLASAVGQEAITTVSNQQAFFDQYTIKANNPDNYNIPRRMRLGLIFSF